MTMTKLSLSLLLGFGVGLTTASAAPINSSATLPNCFQSNYDNERGLFTIKNETPRAANQQCLITVAPSSLSDLASKLYIS